MFERSTVEMKKWEAEKPRKGINESWGGIYVMQFENKLGGKGNRSNKSVKIDMCNIGSHC